MVAERYYRQAMQPLERQLKLVILLLNARRPLTFEELREALGAYGQEDRDAAKRQFERDKDDLRTIGIPLQTEPVDYLDESILGYRIDREAYTLPEITFTPEEAAALFVSAHAPGGNGEAAVAFGKLAYGLDAAILSGLPDRVATGVEASAPHLEAVADAVRRRRLVRFGYRSSKGAEGDREVDAWGLVFSRGSWYLVGRDRTREDVRTFRLSRFLSSIGDVGEAQTPPQGFDARERLRAGPWGMGDPEITARIAFSPKVGPWAISQAPGSEILRTRRDGWVEADVPASGREEFVSWVLSFGPDAEVLAPEEVRRAVVRRLEAVRASL
jgi:proteasome accessory factor B